jgi:soluble lytic murein transglycosylase-like protein
LPCRKGALAETSAATFDRIAAITVQSESAGNPNAVSPKGARGLMQVMPATARNPGFGIRPSNGTQADDVRVGREYLAKMQQQFGGDMAKVWAAYNAGPGRTQAAIAKYGDDWLRYMPSETQNYVRKNMRALGGR